MNLRETMPWERGPGAFCFSMEPTASQLQDIEDIAQSVRWKYAHACGQTGLRNSEDFLQCARMGAFRNHLSFDPAKGSTYRGWLYCGAAGEVRHFIRDCLSTIRLPRSLYEQSRREGRTLDTMPTSLDQAVGEDVGAERCSLGDTLSVEDGAVPMVEFSDILRRMVRNRRHLLICALYWLHGYTQTELGEMFGVSQKQVSRVLRAVAPRLRKVLLAA